MINVSETLIKKELEKFLNFEQEFLKEKLIVSKLYVWPVIRTGLSELILSRLNISMGTPFEGKKHKSFFWTLMKFIENIYLLPKDIFSLKGIFKNTEILIINVSPKRIEIDGDHTNPLIWPLTESLKDYEISILNTQSVDLSINGTSIINISYILKFLTRLSKLFYFFDKQWKRFEKTLIDNVRKNYNFDLNWIEIYSQNFKRIQFISFFVKLIIKFSKPKIIIYNDCGILNASIKAAFNKKIPTVDYQHGLISNYQLLYKHNNSIDEDYKNYLSDYFLSWEPFRLSSFDKNYLTRVCGNPFFEKKFKEYESLPEEKKSILIVSDGHTTKHALQDLAFCLSKRFKDFKIFYKLRPEEYKFWEDEYRVLKNISSKINVIKDDQKDIFYYFKKCKFVIGTSSTALVEAIPFAEVLVYKIGWYFVLDDYIKNNLMRALDSNEDFLNFFENFNHQDLKNNINLNLKSKFSEKIFYKNSKKKINQEISKIIDINISNDEI